MKLPSIIQQELERIPGRWHVETGGRHNKIIVDGKLVAIFPMGRPPENRRAELNIRSNIRKAIEGREHDRRAV